MRARGLVILFAVAVGACSDSQPSQRSAVETADDRPIAEYLALVEQADRMPDRELRCRKYPDLPGNTWPKGSVDAMCALLMKGEPPLSEIAAALADGKGAATLDRRFAAMRDDKQGTDALFRAYWVFDGSEEAQRLAGKWLDQSRGSAFAQVAVAHNYMIAGLDARGARNMADTSVRQIERMERWFERAEPLLERAIQADSHLSPACVYLMGIGRTRGNDALVNRATATCNRMDGRSWFVMAERGTAAEDKWGGNQAMRQRLIEDARAGVAANPALAYFLANSDAEAPYALAGQGHWKEARPGLERAALMSPNALWLGYAGVAAHKAGHELQAIAFLSQALRFSPDSIWFREVRAASRLEVGDRRGAKSDLDLVVSKGKASGSAHSVLGSLLFEDGKVAEAKEMFHRAMRFPDQRLWAFRRWCEIIITRESDVDAALDCSRRLVGEYPRDTEALFMRAWVLTENRQRGADAFSQRFFAQANPQDQREAEMVRQLRRLRGGRR